MSFEITMRYAYIPVGMCVVGLATPWQYVMSRMLNQFGEESFIDSSNLRSLFADTSVVTVSKVPGHPHGAAAASRSTGSFFIERFGREMGKDICFYQCSKSDLRNGRNGSRTWFWAKDSQVLPSIFRPSGAIGIVDVDQYINMPKFMTEYFMPIVLYTFQPCTVAADRSEYTYTFNKRNEVIYRVGGGAEYQHRVWNYDTDVVTTTQLWAGRSWFIWRNWIPFVTTAWLVDKKQIDPDHQIIGLFPIKRWFGPFALLARLLKGRPLRRLAVATGDFLRLTTHGVDGTTVSTGRVNSLLAGCLSARQDAAIASLARTTKSGLALMHVKKLLPDDELGATLIYEYHAQKLPEKTVIMYSGVPTSFVRGFQYKPNEYDPDAKKSLVSFMSPLLDGGFCPDITMGNAKQAVEGRITKVKTTTVVTKFLLRTIDEFIEMLSKDSGIKQHTLFPVEPQEVYERQSRPTQRRILQIAEFVDGPQKGSNFMKREAYGKVTDPRIITTIEGNTKYRYSMYIYSFVDEVLKGQDWYAFGKVPQRVAERVSLLCQRSASVTNTDFSRFDGTISEVPRALERAIMMYFFNDKYHNDLLGLMRKQCNMTCYLSAGGETVTYDSGLARCSGSPETSAFNTLINAFCAYLGWRMTPDNAGGYVDKHTAYSALGVYGGDDGLTGDLPITSYRKAANKLGLTLDLEPVQRGHYGVKFLNRMYGPDVWFGDLTSMCDIRRAISKFHLCVAQPSNVSNITKLAEKAYAYYLSDRHTPIIGSFVTAVVKNLPRNYVFRNIHGNWTAQFEGGSQYPNCVLLDGGVEVRPDWMMEYAGLDYRHDLLLEWINEAPQDLNYFLSPPNNLAERPEPVVKVEVVMEGDLVRPPTDLTTKSERRKRQRRRPVSRRPRGKRVIA